MDHLRCFRCFYYGRSHGSDGITVAFAIVLCSASMNTDLFLNFFLLAISLIQRVRQFLVTLPFVWTIPSRFAKELNMAIEVLHNFYVTAEYTAVVVSQNN